MKCVSTSNRTIGRRIAPVFLVLLAACACGDPAAVSDATPAGHHTLRIIVKPAGTLAADDPSLLAAIRQTLACSPSLLATTADHAFVYECASHEAETAIAPRLEALNRHPIIDYAELDRKRKRAGN